MKVADLYAYHRWATGRLFDVTVALGEETCARDVGRQFSFPTLTLTFAHLYGADAIWLARWKGHAPTALPGADIGSMAAFRERWTTLAAEQRAFVDALAPTDLERGSSTRRRPASRIGPRSASCSSTWPCTAATTGARSRRCSR